MKTFGVLRRAIAPKAASRNGAAGMSPPPAAEKNTRLPAAEHGFATATNPPSENATSLMDPDDPDNWQDEAEDKESTDNERDDRESVPVVDPSYGYRFGDFMGE